jgi:hypothetical protein
LSVQRRKRAAAARRGKAWRTRAASGRAAKAADAVRAPRVGSLTLYAAERWRKVGVSESPRRSLDWLPDPQRDSARGERAQRGRGRRARRKSGRQGAASRNRRTRARMCWSCFLLSPAVSFERLWSGRLLRMLSLSRNPKPIARVCHAILYASPPAPSRYPDRLSTTGPARMPDPTSVLSAQRSPSP